MKHNPAARPIVPTPTVPPAGRSHVWIDFDGTITRRDVIDELIRRHAADGSWRAVEAEWQRGQIGSRECLSRQLATVRATDADLAALLDGIPLDPGLGGLFHLLGRLDVPVTVLSDGLGAFIEPLMRRAGLGHVPVRCNDMARDGTSMRLLTPHSDPACVSAAAHCKCASAAALAEPTRDRGVYIGDGRSDLCPARRVDCAFAKGILATALAAEGIACIPFETLADVAAVLASSWAAL